MRLMTPRILVMSGLELERRHSATLFSLYAPVIGSAGTSDSHSLLYRGYYDTSLHAVDWRVNAHPTTNAGASSWKPQNRIDSASFADKLVISDAGVLSGPTQAAFGVTSPNYTVQIQSGSTHSILQLTNATTGSTPSDGAYIGILSGETSLRVN